VRQQCSPQRIGQAGACHRRAGDRRTVTGKEADQAGRTQPATQFDDGRDSLHFRQLRPQLSQSAEQSLAIGCVHGGTIITIMLRQQVDALPPQRHRAHAAAIVGSQHGLHDVVEAQPKSPYSSGNRRHARIAVRYILTDKQSLPKAKA